MKLNSLYILTIMLAAAAAAGASDGLKEKLHRVLQTTVAAYVVPPMTSDANVQTFCSGNDIDPNSIAITIQQRNDLQAAFGTKYPGVVSSIQAAIGNSGSGITNAIQPVVMGTPIAASAVFAILGLVSFFFFILWSICECCCKKTCCVTQQAQNQSRGKVRIVCWIIGAVLAVTTVIITIVWTVYLGKLIGQVDTIKCGISIVNNDLQNGVNVPFNATQNTTFLGINGLNNMLDQFQSILNQINNIVVNANNIVGRNLPNKASTLQTNFNSLNTGYNGGSYTYPGVSGPGSTSSVQTVFFSTLMPQLISSALSVEVSLLATICNAIDAGAQAIQGISSSTSSVQSSLTTFKSTLGSSLQTPLNDGLSTILGTNGKADYGAQVKSMTRAALIIAIVVVIVFTIIYLFVLFMTAKLNRCHKLKFLPKLIMIIIQLVGIFVLLFCIITTIIAIVFSYGCYAIDGILTDPTFFNKSFGGIVTNPTIDKFLGSCVVVGGSGDLLGAMGVDLSALDKFSNLTNGLQNFTSIQSNLTGSSTPYVYGAVVTNMTNLSKYQILDAPTATNGEDLFSGITNFNTNYKCASDKMAYLASSCATGSTQSTTGDAPAAGVGSNYCLFLGTHPGPQVGPVSWATAAPTRYTVGASACTGSFTSAQGNAYVDQILKSANAYTSNFNTLKTTSPWLPYANSINNVWSGLQSSSTDLTNILNSAQNAITTLSSLSGNFKQLVNCLIIQRDIIILENVMCYQVTSSIITESNVACALGVFIFFYSWCICCGIRLANQMDPAAVNPMDPSGVNPAMDPAKSAATTNYPPAPTAMNPPGPAQQPPLLAGPKMV